MRYGDALFFWNANEREGAKLMGALHMMGCANINHVVFCGFIKHPARINCGA